MSKKREHLTLEIARLRKAIKKKYRQMRYGEAEEERLYTKKYTPLIKELRESGVFLPKQEIKSEDEWAGKMESADADEWNSKSEGENEDWDVERVEREVPATPSVSFIDTEIIAQTPDQPQPSVSTVLSTPKGQSESEMWINSNFTHPLARKYMLKMMKDSANNRTIDHSYGPKIGAESLMIGNKMLQLSDDGEIIIDGVHYKGTPGLYELVFKRLPDDEIYTEADLQAYKDICLRTSAHKRLYDPNGQVNRNKSLKYKNIIEKLFPPKTVSGRGYSYWDDPNELCDRLRHLLASQDAGHTGHANEIASIIEELREAGIIKGMGNARIRTLIR